MNLGNEQAEIQKLWDAIDLDTDYITRTRQEQTARFPYLVWQSPSANPYPRNQNLGKVGQLIIKEDNKEVDPRFAEHPATLGIEELYFQFAGYINQIDNSSLEFEPLVVTGMAGRVYLDEFLAASEEDLRSVWNRPTLNIFLPRKLEERGQTTARCLNRLRMSPLPSRTLM